MSPFSRAFRADGAQKGTFSFSIRTQNANHIEKNPQRYSPAATDAGKAESPLFAPRPAFRHCGLVKKTCEIRQPPSGDGT